MANRMNKAWLGPYNSARREALRAAGQDEKWADKEWNEIPANVRDAVLGLEGKEFAAAPAAWDDITVTERQQALTKAGYDIGYAKHVAGRSFAALPAEVQQDVRAASAVKFASNSDIEREAYALWEKYNDRGQPGAMGVDKLVATIVRETGLTEAHVLTLMRGWARQQADAQQRKAGFAGGYNNANVAEASKRLKAGEPESDVRAWLKQQGCNENECREVLAAARSYESREVQFGTGGEGTWRSMSVDARLEILEGNLGIPHLNALEMARKYWSQLPERVQKEFEGNMEGSFTAGNKMKPGGKFSAKFSSDSDEEATPWLYPLSVKGMLKERQQALRAAKQDEKWAKVEWEQIPKAVRTAVLALPIGYDDFEDFSAKFDSPSSLTPEGFNQQRYDQALANPQKFAAGFGAKEDALRLDEDGLPPSEIKQRLSNKGYSQTEIDKAMQALGLFSAGKQPTQFASITHNAARWWNRVIDEQTQHDIIGRHDSSSVDSIDFVDLTDAEKKMVEQAYIHSLGNDSEFAAGTEGRARDGRFTPRGSNFSAEQERDVKAAYHQIQDSRAMPIESLSEMARMISARTKIDVDEVKAILRDLRFFTGGDAAVKFSATLPTEDGKGETAVFNTALDAANHLAAHGYINDIGRAVARVAATGKWSAPSGAKVERFGAGTDKALAKVISTRAEADRIASKNGADDEDWEYRVEEARGGYIIAVYDGLTLMGYL